MRAIQLIKHGSANSAFALNTVEEPKLKAGDLLIKVEASGINYADILARQGLYKAAPKPPSILGYDVVGVVEQVGEGVDASWIGKRVAAMTKFGGYAEKVATSVHGAAVVNNMETTVAASMATQGATAWYAARVLTHILPGDVVLVHSAAGGVGNILVQLAKQSGAKVIAMASTTEKLNALKKLGADYTVNYKDKDYVSEIQQHIGKRVVDISYNPVGGSTIKKDLQLLNSGGRIVSFGAAEISGKKPNLFSFLSLLFKTGWYSPLFLMAKGKSIIGLNLLPLSKYKPQTVSYCMQSIVREVEQGNISPMAGTSFAASNFAEAHQFVEQRKSSGKVVLRWE
ncbi:MAG: quinone oxidoreductase family protein [Luteibaculaceae bacterium]